MRRISLFSAVATIYQMLEILPRLGGGILLGLLGRRSHPHPHPKDYLLPFRYGMLGILPGSLIIHFSKSVHSEVSPTPAHLGCFVWQSEDSSWIDDDDIVFLNFEFWIFAFCISNAFEGFRETGQLVKECFSLFAFIDSILRKVWDSVRILLDHETVWFIWDYLRFDFKVPDDA